MAVQSDGGSKEDIKTQFTTVEGIYKVLPYSDYSRPNRTNYNNTSSSGGSSCPQVRLSFVCLPESNDSSYNNVDRTKICYNYGRDIYVYTYRGIRKAVDLTNPIDKRSYSKDEIPTCHDFNITTANPDGVYLLLGLLSGQVQIIDPISKDSLKSFNSGERLIDKSKVTCVRWIPGSANQFFVSHSSGHMYLYNEELSCGIDRPHYQLVKQGDGYSVHACKTKNTKNPLFKWEVGEGPVNEFAFSPCAKYLAIVSQDGLLRVFNFETLEIVGSAKSYFGGLLCLCWSPDGRYVVTGGEDDLITVWSFHEKRVVARGQGHKSWVTVVSFDPYATLYSDMDGYEMCNDELTRHAYSNDIRACKLYSAVPNSHSNSSRNSVTPDSLGLPVISYRLGSIGQDTLLCLWDLKDDSLKQPYFRPRSSTVVSKSTERGCCSNSSKCNSAKETYSSSELNHIHGSLLTSKFSNLNFGEKRDKEKDIKRNSSAASKSSGYRNSNKNQIGNSINNMDNTYKIIGTPQCPNLDECPLLEPMVCKKVSQERLTSLVFHEDCIVTACQDGCVLTWCRPGRQSGNCQQHYSSSPTTASSVPSSGTVV